MLKRKELFPNALVFTSFLLGELLPVSFWWISWFSLVFLAQLFSFSPSGKVRLLRLIIFAAGGLSSFLFNGLFAYFLLSLFFLLYFFTAQLARTKIGELGLIISASFLIFFELFFLVASFKIALIPAWLFFLFYVYLMVRVYAPELRRFFALIFAFVLSQFFLIFYFLPFGYLTGAALTLLFFVFGLSFVLNQLGIRLALIFFIAVAALLLSSGLRPRGLSF